MATTKAIVAPRTTTLISDTLAPFGHIAVPPEPRDKSSAEREAERQADRINYRAALALLGWDDATFAVAVERFSFPKPIARVVAGKHAGQGLFSRRAIDAWRDRLLEFSEAGEVNQAAA